MPTRRTWLTPIKVVLNSYTFAFTALTCQNVCCEKGLFKKKKENITEDNHGAIAYVQGDIYVPTTNIRSSPGDLSLILLKHQYSQTYNGWFRDTTCYTVSYIALEVNQRLKVMCTHALWTGFLFVALSASSVKPGPSDAWKQSDVICKK